MDVIAYLAGPMTGLPGFNYRAFDDARDVLEAEGWTVISPTDLDRENLGIAFDEMDGTEDLSEYRTDFARQDLDALLDAHAVIVLPGWERSTGARNEATVASWLGLPIFEFETRKLVEWEADFASAGTRPLPPPSPVEKALELVGISSDTGTVSPRREMLEEAADLVDGDRNASYGDPSQDFRRTADLWSTYLDGKTTLDPHDVAAMMALLKISRLRWSPEKRDSWVDLAGYAACGLSTIPEAWQK